MSKLDVKKINTLYNCEGYPQLFESESTKSESTKSESTKFESTISESESIEDPILNDDLSDLIEGDKLFSTPLPSP